jgi:hypothetical protein
MTEIELTLKPTAEFFEIAGMPMRLWQGTNERGQKVVAIIGAVAFDEGDGRATEGLVSIPPPTGEDARRWAAEVLSRRYPDDS